MLQISAPVLMVAATFLFATMGVCVKFAATDYGTGEMVFYRGIVGAVAMAMLMRVRGETIRTRLPAMHFWRSFTGVSALSLWFYAIGVLPLATAVTLNYMAPIWMTLLLIGGAALLRGTAVEARFICTVLVGFTGVACILQPAMEQDQAWGGLMGLLSGLLTAMAYLQISALGRAGEPEDRVVFYFSAGSMAGGALETSLFNEWHAHTPQGLGILLAIGILATLAQLMITRAYGKGRILVIGSLQYLGVAWSFIYGVVLFDDPVTSMALLGMALVVAAGIAAVGLRERVSSAGDLPLPPEP